jgi:hypothetical protein
MRSRIGFLLDDFPEVPPLTSVGSIKNLLRNFKRYLGDFDFERRFLTTATGTL